MLFISTFNISLRGAERALTVEGYELSHEESTGDQIDLLTGVEVALPDRIFVLLEGLREGSMVNLLNSAGWPQGATLTSFRTLFNSTVHVAERMYASFGIGLPRIQLSEPLPTVLCRQELYFKGHPLHGCLAALSALQQMAHAERMSQALKQGYFPPPESLQQVRDKLAVAQARALHLGTLQPSRSSLFGGRSSAFGGRSSLTRSFSRSRSRNSMAWASQTLPLSTIRGSRDAPTPTQIRIRSGSTAISDGGSRRDSLHWGSLTEMPESEGGTTNITMLVPSFKSRQQVSGQNSTGSKNSGTGSEGDEEAEGTALGPFRSQGGRSSDDSTASNMLADDGEDSTQDSEDTAEQGLLHFKGAPPQRRTTPPRMRATVSPPPIAPRTPPKRYQVVRLDDFEDTQAGARVFNYSSQRLNASQATLRHLRARAKEELGPKAQLTTAPQFFSGAFSLVDEEAEEKKRQAEDQNRWQTSDGFDLSTKVLPTVADRTGRSTVISTTISSDLLGERLPQSHYDDKIAADQAHMRCARDNLPWSQRHRDLRVVPVKPGNTFGPESSLTAHHQNEEERRRMRLQEAEQWRAKMVVADPYFHVHRTPYETRAQVPQVGRRGEGGKACWARVQGDGMGCWPLTSPFLFFESQLDRYANLLKDPPQKAVYRSTQRLNTDGPTLRTELPFDEVRKRKTRI